MAQDKVLFIVFLRIKPMVFWCYTYFWYEVLMDHTDYIMSLDPIMDYKCDCLISLQTWLFSMDSRQGFANQSQVNEIKIHSSSSKYKFKCSNRYLEGRYFAKNTRNNSFQRAISLQECSTCHYKKSQNQNQNKITSFCLQLTLGQLLTFWSKQLTKVNHYS